MDVTINDQAGADRQPIIRTADQAEEDREQLVQNVKAGNFANWPNEAGFTGLDEVRGPIELEIQGTIPTWVEGSLYRTGPGGRDVEGTPKGLFRISHWFDGFAHSHKFDITVDEEGKVHVMYSSRRQSDRIMARIKKNGDKGLVSFGQKKDPCVGLFAKVMSVYRMAIPHRHTVDDNICVAVLADVPGLPSSAGPRPIAASSGHRSANTKNTWLTTDTNALREMDPDTLEPIGFATQDKLHPDLVGPISCAHAQRDPDNGDMFNFNLAMGRHSVYRVFRVNADTGTTDILATISDLPPAYNHSFFLSPSFVILCCTSAHMGWKGMKLLWEQSVVGSFGPMTDDKKMKWLVIDRRHGRGLVARFETDAGFFFHSVNSFEEPVEASPSDVDLYCDMIQYPNLDIINSLYYDVLTNQKGAANAFWGVPNHHNNCHCRLARHRFRVQIPTPSSPPAVALNPNVDLVFTVPAPHVGEMPSINAAYHTRKHRYLYTMVNRGHSTLVDTVSKLDLQTLEVKFWNVQTGHSPGEPIFVGRPTANDGSGEEDDGVLLVIVLDGIESVSYLVCLDARTMVEMGRAMCKFPIAIGFHGIHIATAAAC